jgi:hypothetical protein
MRGFWQNGASPGNKARLDGPLAFGDASRPLRSYPRLDSSSLFQGIRAMFTCCRAVVFVIPCILLPTVGCLSLGGKTTYVQESSETASRISALETRLGILEQAVLNGPSATVMPPPQVGTRD